MKEDSKARIRALQTELPGLDLTEEEVDKLAHQLEALVSMLRQLDEIDVEGWEPATIFVRRQEA